MKREISYKLRGALLCLLGYLPAMTAGDNAHFYRAAKGYLIPPYSDEDWKTSFDASYGFGEAKKGRNSSGKSCNVLDIYGPANILYMKNGVPVQGDPTSYPNTLLTQLSAYQSLAGSDSTFGTLSFEGQFCIHELNFNIRQNLKDNFFLDIHLPVRLMKTSDISFVDQSPTSGALTQTIAEWVAVKNNFDTILNAYGYENFQEPQKQNDVGDLSLIVGWQHTDQESFDFVDYVDIAFRGGILFPTGGRENVSKPFSIPAGYNGHWGIPLNFDISVGARDWLTIGFNVGALFFFDETRKHRMKTQNNQAGWLHLAEGEAKAKRGALWNVGLYADFGNFYKGVSGLIGYSFNAQEHSELHPLDTTTFSESIVNSDARLLSWQQHNLHFKLNYDFKENVKDKRYVPRIGIYYDVPVAGKRIFSTYMVGGTIGVDCCWNF